MDRIKLKNIKFSEWNSEETNCFRGDIYFDNKKIGFCSNDGRGGDTYCYPLDIEYKEKYKEMEEYCKTLPDIEYSSKLTGYESFSIQPTIENIIDRLFENWLEQKEDKKMEKNFSKGICFGTKFKYEICSFKRGGKTITINELIKNSEGITFLKNFCDNKKKEGHTILNNNLPFEV